MHERELRTFVRIAELGRMDLAARALGYSQPAISYHVRSLERALGVRLFRREAAGSRPTPEAERLLPWARAALRLFDLMRSSADGKRRAFADEPSLLG
ncbi:hypothetical protein GCM10012275_09240 [Longimycelium tulufanense]|uniref:HTH lysR-type domain-containing protein n=1 Tax=Longimycelium tulufanense TaxID=907463 RepID=A0A8J3CCR8_9PSEU|nr:LysR family transcriptional regulator [Longimycelium tulufanense]GGM40425.1 hypothetical protein GCM10012275_09240 [Longimycelium tulufanense]